MRAYSMDIRERVIEDLDHESMRKTAKRFRVSEYFVYRLKQRYRAAGTLAPKPPGGGQGPLVDEAGGEFIRAVLAEALDLTRKKRPSTTPNRRRNVSNGNGLPTPRSSPR